MSFNCSIYFDTTEEGGARDEEVGIRESRRRRRERKRGRYVDGEEVPMIQTHKNEKSK